jgi:cephalosporin-C deacetylase-like acetyl esterase
MTRRELLGSAAALAALRLRAQTPISYRAYGRCLPGYLTALAEDAYARRSARIGKLTTEPAIREYQAWTRRTFFELIGGLPERTPLELRTTGAFERDGYRLEKVVYQSRPGLFVTANLYLPKSGTAPHPAVLFHMGHAAEGKANAGYQRCCQGLARLGYVVLAFDPMGQGERSVSRQGPTDQHSAAGRQMLLLGETVTAFQLWDAIRSLDVLAAHPAVDAKRIGSTGQSGGGTLTMLLAAADDRLAAAAVSSGNTENFSTRPFFPPGSTDDAEQDLIGSGPVAFDRWDLLWPIAPKPLLVATSARDFFGTYSPSYASSGREEFARLRGAYAVLGAEAKLASFETPLPHGLSYSLRVAIYDWFERHLKGSDRRISEEPPTAPETPETLRCGATGKTPFELIAARAREIQTPETPPDLRKLLAIDEAPANPALRVCGSTRYRECDIQAVETESARGVWPPAWLFLPRAAWKRLLVVVEPNGRNGRWHEDELYPQLAAAGIAVCALDVRGVGDLEPQFSPGSANYERSHQSEEAYAWASLILGHSLLGQRTQDVAAMVQALGRQYPQSEIAVAARDKMTVPAVCAAAIEPRIARLYLARHLVSWRSLVESETYSQPFANFVPDVLRATDLPLIARRLAPRPVVVAGAVDANGHPVLRAQVSYSNYREEAAWDLSALSQF